MANKAVGSMSEWSGVLKDVFRQIDDGGITLPMTKDFSERRNPFKEREAARKVEVVSNLSNAGITFATPPIPDAKMFLEEMAEFYDKVYAVKLPETKLPPTRPGFCWGLIMIPGITIERDLAGCKKNYPVWRWTNDDLDVLTKDRHDRFAAKTPYAVWLRDRVEADEELKTKSYNDLVQAGILGITLPERIRLERWFFWKTGKHLDIQNITLCAGSRDSVGRVPSVDWCGDCDELLVHWCAPDDASGSLRSREVVS